MRTIEGESEEGGSGPCCRKGSQPPLLAGARGLVDMLSRLIALAPMLRKRTLGKISGACGHRE